MHFSGVAKVSPIFEVYNIEEVGDYNSIFVLDIVSKVLERIMVNRTYPYFKENGMFSPKQLAFK